MGLILKPHALVHLLLAEMSRALEAMELGDYDLAYCILADRVRPQETLTKLPNTSGRLDILSVTKRMAELAPSSVLADRYGSMLEVAAGSLTDAFRSPSWLSRPENALTAAALAAEFGLSLEWEFESESPL